MEINIPLLYVSGLFRERIKQVPLIIVLLTLSMSHVFNSDEKLYYDYLWVHPRYCLLLLFEPLLLGFLFSVDLYMCSIVPRALHISHAGGSMYLLKIDYLSCLLEFNT